MSSGEKIEEQTHQQQQRQYNQIRQRKGEEEDADNEAKGAGGDEATTSDIDSLKDNALKDRQSGGFYFGQPLIWLNIVAISLFHVAALYCFLTFPYIQRPLTFLWAVVIAVTTSFGVGAGVHRLWTHRSYKAKTPLRIILLCCYCMAGMNPLYDWVRDHRVHHKFSETDADPHNSNRGFFFSHVGWLMMKKHPEVIRKGRQIDMSDITNDPVCAFGQKFFLPMKILFCFVLPTLVPVYCWNEDWYYAIASQVFMRYSYVLNVTWCVNSVAHMFGGRPYDKTIAPVENKLISCATGGEGWHNYHHVFPWDYKASEIGHPTIDLSTVFIQTFAKIGWAYDLKEPTADLVKSIAANKGDGTYAEVEEPMTRQ
ncbi:unnamed protein product [Trichogramma brassicae]|uniref:Fatty acid desaturase domain-containing protein n=1 Tax=Trichogramma brassicae TaxID=86971 RepID=A0A6H5I8Y1_9HYME|nr:unnamed protein product [Trichogramma brassicae]